MVTMTALVTRCAIALLYGTAAFASTFEKLHSIPEGWKFERNAADDTPIRLQIGLRQGDLAGFEKALVDMSTPDHPNYGKHFKSHEEMKRMLLPSRSAVSSVLTWLKDAGIDMEDIKEDSDWINIRTTVGKANDLLDTEFGWYLNTEHKNARKLRTLEYSIPDDVAQHVDLVQPTTRFGQIKAHHSTAQIMDGEVDLSSIAGTTDAPASFAKINVASALPQVNLTACNTTITPQCLQYLYKIDYNASAKSGSTLSYASYLEESARYADLALFETNIYPRAAGQNFSVVTYNGGVNDQTSSADSGEANLDNQYMLGLGAPLPVTEFITGGRGPLVTDLDQPDPNDNNNEPYLIFLQNVLKLPQKELPLVISTSYGENEQSVPESYARSVCSLIGQLGSRGVSVIFSSGDSGVGSACLSNDGKNTTKFQPQYPASCPWVTSVGSTRNVPTEVATFFSSGGFSDLWERPGYQDQAVSKYLRQLGNKQKPYYNARGRGFPDIALQGVGYAVYDKGVLKRYQGTSCSAPAFGGIVGLLNDARLKAHLPPLGFLNPLLYKTPEGFTDITLGGSTGCNGRARFNGPPNGSPVIPFASWNATAGWDPVTGLGTPVFPKLLKAAVPNRYRA